MIYEILSKIGIYLCSLLTQEYEVMILMLKLDVIRVAELGSLSWGAKMALEIFVKRVFTIFATNALFLRVIANLQI